MFGIDDLINAGASMYGASEAAGAAEAAAKAQERAANKALNLQREIYKRQIALQEPFRSAGVTAINRLAPLLDYKTFGMNQFQADPGYAFRLAEGQKALERSAAAKGGLLSGATLKGIQRYGQDLASQEYQNAFQRYLAERVQRISPLYDVARLGQSAASGTAASAGTYGANAAQLMQDVGAARASGYVGGANALTNAISNYLGSSSGQNLGSNLSGLYNRVSSYFGGGGGGGGGSNAGLMENLNQLGVF